MEWLDLNAALAPLLGRFRRWLNKTPSREFSELDAWGKLGRLALMAVVVGVLCAPAIWLLAK